MKDFILYPEALELKQLGFDEPCFGKWLSSLQSNWKDYELILEMGMNEEFEDNRNVYLLQGACSAPTYSQAFRWFREKYGLYNYVTTYDSTDFEWYIYDKDQNDWEDDTTQNTYEQAELACLQHLIKIVKEQQK
jgi:hypothetical protein